MLYLNVSISCIKFYVFQCCGSRAPKSSGEKKSNNTFWRVSFHKSTWSSMYLRGQLGIKFHEIRCVGFLVTFSQHFFDRSSTILKKYQIISRIYQSVKIHNNWKSKIFSETIFFLLMTESENCKKRVFFMLQ